MLPRSSAALGGIAGREDVIDAWHAQIGIDDQAAQIVPRRGNLRGQRRRAHARRPDHRGAFDTLAIGQGHATLVDRRKTPRQGSFPRRRRGLLPQSPAAGWCRSGPRISSLRSTITTRMSVSRPRMARSRSGISVAVSMPVKPPPATTTVLRAFEAGRFANAWMCSSSLIASSICSTPNACSASPGMLGRKPVLPVARTNVSYVSVSSRPSEFGEDD